MDMDEIKMDEIHHKELMFDKTFQMNLFLVNNYPWNHDLFIFQSLLNNILILLSGLNVM
jgi:hypothetical protein